jgi:hypothetical protein
MKFGCMPCESLDASGRSYIPGFYLNSTFQGRPVERLVFGVICPIPRVADIISIHNQTESGLKIFYITIFAPFKTALQSPGKIICSLKASTLSRCGGDNIDRGFAQDVPLFLKTKA